MPRASLGQEWGGPSIRGAGGEGICLSDPHSKHPFNSPVFRLSNSPAPAQGLILELSGRMEEYPVSLSAPALSPKFPRVPHGRARWGQD